MPSHKLNDNSENFSEFLSNLRLEGDSTLYSGGDASSTNYKYTAGRSNEAYNESMSEIKSSISNGFSNLQYRSKYKTIKIAVISNKNGIVLFLK